MKIAGLITLFALIFVPITPVIGQDHDDTGVTPDNFDRYVDSPENVRNIKNKQKTCIVNFFDRSLKHKDLKDLMLAIDRAMVKGCNDILLVINSSGGKINVGVAAYNYLSKLPVRLRTHNIANTSSAAILLYCAGDIRTASHNSYFLVHNGQLSPGSGLTIAEVSASRDIFQLQINFMHEIIANCTDKTEHDIESILKGTELLLNSTEAKDFGLVDEVKDIAEDIANYSRIEFVGSDD